MAQLIIVNGPPSSGKTVYARNATQGYDDWRVAGNMKNALTLLSEGFNVVLDDEQLTPYNVTVIRFGPKKDR